MVKKKYVKGKLKQKRTSPGKGREASERGGKGKKRRITFENEPTHGCRKGGLRKLKSTKENKQKTKEGKDIEKRVTEKSPKKKHLE